MDLRNSAALQNSTLAAGGTNVVFDSAVAGHAFTVGGLSGSNNFVLQDNAPTPDPVTLSVGASSLSSTYSGALSGSGSLVKTGTGTLTLMGSNAYTGGTSIVNGTLRMGSAQ